MYAVSTVHIPGNVRTAPTFAANDTAWLSDKDILDCLRIIHDTVYPSAAFQANYHARHHPILNASLVSRLSLGLPDAAPARRTDVHLRDVLADSSCLDAASLGCSPVIVLGDQTHFRTIWVIWLGQLWFQFMSTTPQPISFGDWILPHLDSPPDVSRLQYIYYNWIVAPSSTQTIHYPIVVNVSQPGHIRGAVQVWQNPVPKTDGLGCSGHKLKPQLP